MARGWDTASLGLLTPQLRETFYYAREIKSDERTERNIEPIKYSNQ